MKQLTVSLLMQESHEDIKSSLNISCVEKQNFVSLPESDEEEEDDTEKVDLQYYDFKSFL